MANSPITITIPGVSTAALTAGITGRMITRQASMADFEFDIRGVSPIPPPHRRIYRFWIARAVRDGAMSTAEGIRRLWNAGSRGAMLNPWEGE